MRKHVQRVCDIKLNQQLLSHADKHYKKCDFLFAFSFFFPSHKELTAAAAPVGAALFQYWHKDNKWNCSQWFIKLQQFNSNHDFLQCFSLLWKWVTTYFKVHYTDPRQVLSFHHMCFLQTTVYKRRVGSFTTHSMHACNCLSWPHWP